MAVADKAALLDKLREHLRPGQLSVELLLRSLPRLKEACRQGAQQSLSHAVTPNRVEDRGERERVVE